jgi:hypothetical protein
MDLNQLVKDLEEIKGCIENDHIKKAEDLLGFVIGEINIAAQSERKRKENIITQLYAAKNGYEKAIEEVLKSYPLDIFPDTSQSERDPIIEKYPGFIDRTSAMMGRHIAKVILERAMYFAREILEDGGV